MARATTRSSEQSDKRTRASRDQELRSANPVHKKSEAPWTRAESLEAPDPRPGMRQKWVRTSVYGKEDMTNVMRKQREGWAPRRPDTVPKNFPVPTIQHGRLGDCIAVEGMILMEMPVTRVAARNKFFDAKKKLMTSAIEREINEASQSVRRGGGFGAIKKAERSTPMREVRVAPDTAEADETELGEAEVE